MLRRHQTKGTLPKGDAIIIRPNNSRHSTHAVRINDTFHHMQMQLPVLLWGGVLAVTGLDGILNYFVVFEGFGEAEGGLFVLTLLENTDRVCAGSVAGAGCL